jgi:hypothetical protein
MAGRRQGYTRAWLKTEQSKASRRKATMPKEILSKDQIKQIAMAMPSDEAGLSECEANLAAASTSQQRVIKRAWKLKLSAERLVEAEKRATNSTKRR